MVNCKKFDTNVCDLKPCRTRNLGAFPLLKKRGAVGARQGLLGNRSLANLYPESLGWGLTVWVWRKRVLIMSRGWMTDFKGGDAIEIEVE